MMRKLFWILLLANVVLFAAMQRGWLGLGEQASQTQPALHEDMIRLLDTPQSAPVAVLPAPVPASAPVDVSSVVTAQSNTLDCLEWGDFLGSDLTRTTAA